MKKINLVFMALIAALIMSCGESSEKYNKRAYAVADSIISYTDINLELVSDCQSMWRSVIFNSQYISPAFHLTSYCSDFNDGISRFKEDVSKFPIIKGRKKTVDSLYETVKEAPEKSKTTNEQIKELCSIYSRSLEMILEPSGNLTSYTENANNLITKYKELKSKIEIEKK